MTERCNKTDFGNNLCSLHVWHFSALHKPPRTIFAGQIISNVDIYDNWVVYLYHEAPMDGPLTVSAYNLAGGSQCTKALSDTASCSIQYASPKAVNIIHLNSNSMSDPTLVGIELLQDDTKAFDHLAETKVMMCKRDNIWTRRIDDSRFVVCAPTSDAPSTMPEPNLRLMEVSNSAEEPSLTEVWSQSISVMDVQPIVSRNLLRVKQRNGRISLRSLLDGTEVRMDVSGSWIHSGLYPPKIQWHRIPEKTAWRDPRRDDTLAISRSTKCESSPSALAYAQNDVVTVLDYAADNSRQRIWYRPRIA
ncbi:hypothetical protein THASP1DRAFT_31752 [Thamnocephalis sphaerospora]|uniref:Uncharacterized protein n=1 Tax=Thamnocephalis sphaerospora TaxID=78915 RepID=A0A4P9XKZ8_9FUNG|nr:hypothetical protein THASP1DRAFT_31752 [Thamnocephalis sphaerospora]|eukprot:RKP06436.1 hypothetical protein THASP1DRAFT_31752 [Thamnocephalis sphaerospora]